MSIPETQELFTEDSSKDGKNVTGNQTKTSSQRPSTSTRKIDHLTNTSDLLATRNIPRYKTKNTDDKTVDVTSQEHIIEDKVQYIIYKYSLIDYFH